VPLYSTVRTIARKAPEYVGSPWAFVLSLVAVVVWLALGPLFGWSDAWLVLPATATSIFAFLIVVLIQYTQNRDTRAIQLKLDELILDLGSRNDMVRLERLADEDLERIERDFLRLLEKVRKTD
jgi:low affinity Fe/Cu permease